MQLMPQTARDLQVSDAFSPKENIDGGTRYLRYLLDLFNQDMTLALAAYNAGPEKVNLYRGIPPYQETRTYVQKVTQIYNQLKGRPPFHPVIKPIHDPGQPLDSEYSQLSDFITDHFHPLYLFLCSQAGRVPVCGPL